MIVVEQSIWVGVLFAGFGIAGLLVMAVAATAYFSNPSAWWSDHGRP